METPIIGIEVDSSKFDEFLNKFNEYSDKVSQLPAQWKNSGSSLSTAISSQSRGLVVYGKEVRNSASEVRNLSKAWESVKKNTTAVSRTLKETTLQLARMLPGMGALSLSLGGILALPAIGLGLFTGLQDWAGKGRTSNLGIGVNQGERVAFNNVFGSYGMSESTLAHIAGLKANPAEWGQLSIGVGRPLSQQEILKSDPAQLLMESLLKIRDNPNQMQAFVQARALGLDPLQFNNIRNRSDAEIRHDVAEYRIQAGQLNISDSQQRGSQEFMRQMHLWSSSIKKMVFEDMIPLTPYLTSLVKSFKEASDAFLKSPVVKEMLIDLTSGLKSAATYLKSKEFESDVKSFESSVHTISSSLTSLSDFLDKYGGFDRKMKTLKEFGTNVGNFVRHPSGDTAKAILTSGTDSDYIPGTQAQVKRNPGGASEVPRVPPGYDVGKVETTLANGGGLLQGPHKIRTSPSALLPNYVVPNKQDIATLKGIIHKLGKASGLPSNLLVSMWREESGYGANQYNASGAVGNWQMMPGTAKQYGVHIGDFFSEMQGAKKYISHLLLKYKGNLKEALVAWNWGPGNLDKDIRRHGKKWFDHVPPESHKFAIEIMNTTGTELYSQLGSVAASYR